MKFERKAISKRLRYEILRRDGYACRYCGAHAPAVRLHVDHILAVSKGGTNAKSNLCTACASCNLGKGALAAELEDAHALPDDYNDDAAFVYCDPWITSLYGEIVV